MKHFMTWFSAAALTLMAADCVASPADTLNALSSQLDTLEQEFSIHHSSTANASLEKRLEDGIVLQTSGDHQRAEYIFMDILAHNEWKGKPAYQAAQYQLASSLYEDGYYRLSQHHLIDLLQTGVGTERTNGVLLLLQVAQKTGDWAEVNDALASGSDFSRNPAYLYIMGRAMYLQGDYATARKSLQSIDTSNDEWYVKAEYLLGVLDTIDHDLESALQHFEIVSADTRKFRGSDDVHALAMLARARIYYEQTQWSKAIDCYQKVTDNSRYFADVLYEMGWTHIRLEDYFAAQQKFELLILSYPENRHALESRKLLADLKRELGQYDDALASYQKIVDEFEPVMSEMENESVQLEGRKYQLKQTIEAEQYKNVHIVPERAKGLVSIGSDVNRVEMMLNALSESDVNTNESESIVAEISSILQSDASIRNLPEFQHYTHLADDIRINTVLAGFEFTSDNAKVSDEMKQIASEISKLPRNTQEREIMASIQASERDERQARLLHAKLELESLQHKTKILKQWMSSGRISSMTESEKANLSAQLNEYENKMAQLQPMISNIESKLTQLRTTMSLNSTSSEIRNSNIHALQSLLEEQWSNDSNSASQDYRNLMTQERALLRRLDNFDNGINASIQNRASDFRSRLEREALVLQAEKDRYQSVKSDVGSTAGEISARYWQSVYDQIRDMVLNADLGMVDIAWLQKDARSKALSTAMEERKKEREVLEQDFKQFLKESGQE